MTFKNNRREVMDHDTELAMDVSTIVHLIDEFAVGDSDYQMLKTKKPDEMKEYGKVLIEVFNTLLRQLIELKESNRNAYNAVMFMNNGPLKEELAEYRKLLKEIEA